MKRVRKLERMKSGIVESPLCRRAHSVAFFRDSKLLDTSYSFRRKAHLSYIRVGFTIIRENLVKPFF